MAKKARTRAQINARRDYKQEAAYEDTPAQVKRREARDRARRKAIKDGRVRKGDGKELDHVGYHVIGSLDNVPTRVTTRRYNRKRQPPHKAPKR